MEGGMMAARRMAAVEAVVPKNHCIEGTAAFLSHYLPPEKGAELMRVMRPGLLNDDVFTISTTIIGGKHSRLTDYTGSNWNQELDRFFVDVQKNKRMGYYTSQYEYKNGTVGGHITGFLWDPETETVAFFEPREQGAAGTRCSFFVRHVDILKYKAGPAMRGDAEGNYRGLFGEYAILNTAYNRGPLSPMFKQAEGAIKSHKVTEVIIFDTVPKIYEGDAAPEKSGAFQEPLKDVKLQEHDRQYYTDAQFLESQVNLQSAFGNARWNALSDDERYSKIIRNLMKMYPDIVPFEPMPVAEQWKGWEAEAAAAAAAAGAGAAAPMAEVRDEDQIPTPKIDAMEGEGMPQHMSRGDYHTSGVNRKYRYDSAPMSGSGAAMSRSADGETRARINKSVQDLDTKILDLKAAYRTDAALFEPFHAILNIIYDKYRTDNESTAAARALEIQLELLRIEIGKKIETVWGRIHQRMAIQTQRLQERDDIDHRFPNRLMGWENPFEPPVYNQ